MKENQFLRDSAKHKLAIAKKESNIASDENLSTELQEVIFVMFIFNILHLGLH